MSRFAGAVFAALSLFSLTALGAEGLSYLGSWSNGRGETLIVTRNTLQFASERPVPYRDVTRVTDGATFELQITSSGKINAFPGKTLLIEVENDSMTMTGYDSHAELMQGGAVQSRVVWERESGPSGGRRGK